MKQRTNPNELQTRAVGPKLTQLRAEAEGEVRTITGYAVVWNALSCEMDEGDGPFRERVLPGAFTESLETFDLYMLAFHDSKQPPLGRRAIDGSAETLKAVEDDHGLRVLNYVPPSPHGDSVYVSITRHDLVYMSFGFDIVEERWIVENGVRVREIVKADIHEVSVVIWPAYDATSIKARSYGFDEPKNEPKRSDEKDILLLRQAQEELNF